MLFQRIGSGITKRMPSGSIRVWVGAYEDAPRNMQVCDINFGNRNWRLTKTEYRVAMWRGIQTMPRVVAELKRLAELDKMGNLVLVADAHDRVVNLDVLARAIKWASA